MRAAAMITMNKFDIWNVYVKNEVLSKLGEDLHSITKTGTICSQKASNLTASDVRDRLISRGWSEDIIVSRSPINFTDHAD